jgi:DNA-binding transcriptional ArsR family regulator
MAIIDVIYRSLSKRSIAFVIYATYFIHRLTVYLSQQLLKRFEKHQARTPMDTILKPHRYAPEEKLAKKQASFCRVFSNARRVLIIWALAEKELSVGAIAEEVGSSIQNISQHLGIMKAHNIVTSRREGQTIYYRIEREVLKEKCFGLLQENMSEIRNEISYREKT